MTPTPQTDAHEYLSTDTDPPVRLGAVDADFARKMERELIEAKTTIERLLAVGGRLRQWSNDKHANREWDVLMGVIHE